MPRFYSSRRFQRAAVGAGLAVAAAAAIYVMWPKHVTTTADQSRPALVPLDVSRHDSNTYLSRHAVSNDFTCPATATKCYRWKGNALGGSLWDDLSGDNVELAATGTPTYQQHSPWPAKGQGRKSWRFARATNEYVAAAATSTLEIGTATEWSVTATFQVDQMLTQRVLGSAANANAEAGWGIFIVSNGVVGCNLNDGVNRRYCASGAGTVVAGKLLTVSCTWTRAGANWGDPVVRLNNQAASASCSGTAPAGDIPNTNTVKVGNSNTGAAADAFDGYVSEILVANRALTTAETDAFYRQSLGTGTIWNRPANTIAHYTFAETSTASGLRDVSGNGNHLTAVTGTPDVQQDNLPWPMSTGFGVRGVYSPEGDVSYFEAANTTAADQTTNDFSVSFAYMHVRRITNSGFIINKLGTTGWRIAVDSATEKLYAVVTDGSGSATGVISDAVVTPYEWHYYTINFDRDGNASAFIDGATQTAVVNISGRPGSLSDVATKMRLFRNTGVAGYDVEGALSNITVANGLTTLAEHNALAKAFKVPSDVTYTQTSTWKWPLLTEPGFGDRLATIAPGQWPMMQSSTAVDASKNPLGTGFPGHGAATNVLGYPNEVESWAASGAVVAANTGEAPDGSLTADRITFSADAQSVGRAVVGGGGIAAGETWCSRLRYRVVSGTCAGVRVNATLTAVGTNGLTNSTTWSTTSICDTVAGHTKGVMIYAVTHGSCVLEVADAEYYQNNLPVGSCTACTGAVNCVCNASYYSQSWVDRTGLMPANLERIEVVAAGTLAPRLHPMTTKRTLWKIGQYAEVTEGQEPAFALYTEGGGIESLSKGKPLQINEEHRQYVAGWNLRDGLTNTSPRRYASLQMERNRTGGLKYAPLVLNGRQNSDAEPRQTDLNAYKLSVGCDHDGANCYNGLIEKAELWARPAQQAVSVDTDIAAAADFTGPAWLQQGYTPDLCDFTFGVSSANRWCWRMGEYGGSLYDSVNGVELAPVNTPIYQVPSGLLVRGQGRFGGYRNDGTIRAIWSATGGSVGSANALTWSAIYSDSGTANCSIWGSQDGSAAGGPGWGIKNTNSPAGTQRPSCYLSDGAGALYGRYVSAGVPAGQVNVLTCVATRPNPATNWTLDVYLNGVPGSALGTTGATFTADLTRPGVYTRPATAGTMDGSLYEAAMWPRALTPTEILDLYKRTTQTGKYWSDIGTQVHYKFNEPSIVDGIGVRDHSGNGHHMSTVSTPVTLTAPPLPWPAGSGVSKPAVSLPSGASYFSATQAAWVPAAAQPYSFAGWFRAGGSTDGLWPTIFMGNTTNGFGLYDSVTNTILYLYIGGANGRAACGKIMDDGKWHFFAGRWTESGGVITPECSVDGAPFAGALVTISGDPSANGGLLYAGGFSVASPSRSLAGLSIWKNYALTDADVAQLYRATAPVTGLTYSRTSTGAKGICYDVGVDPVDGVRVRCFGNNEVPYAYSSSLCGLPGNERMCLGLPSHMEVTNLSAYSEALASWSPPVRATVATNVAIAPDGTLTAESITEDATAANTHYAVKSVTVTAVDHTTTIYLKKGDRWGVHVMGDSTLHGAYVNLATCTLGTVSGGAVASVIGAPYGWCKLVLTDVPAAGARNWFVFLAEADADMTFDGNPVTYPVGAYVWGVQVAATSLANVPYCPTDASTQTCNAPTAISTTSLGGWDETKGVISSTAYVGGVAGNEVVWRLKPAGTGSSFLYARGDAYFYNSGAVLQQRLGNISIVATQPYGAVAVFDSSGAFYGSRRAALRFYGSDYAGVTSTYSADTGVNWTIPTPPSALWVGMDSGGANQINGTLGSVYIWKTR